MADIDEIISGVRGNTKYDFAALGDPVKSFFDASKQRAEFDQRRAFKDGVPTDENGQPDFASMSKTLFQKGDIGQGMAAANLGLQQQTRADDAKFFANGGAPTAQPQSTIVSPPSANRTANATVAPPLNKGGVQNKPTGSPQGDQPGSIVGVVSSAGIPDELAGPVIAQVSALTKTDPNATLDPSIAPRVQQVVQAAAQRLRSGQQPQPAAASPAPPPPPQAAPVSQGATPSAQPVSQFANAQAQGLIPPGVDPMRYVAGLKLRAAASPNPQTQKLALQQLEAINKASELTTEEKQFSASSRNPGLDDYTAQKNADAKRAESVAAADVKEQQEYIDAGKAASQRLTTLNAITNVASSDKNVSFGFGADTELKVKMALERLGFDFGDLSGSQLIQKMNASLASEMAKTLTGRPTQFEFKTFLANNPGLLLDKTGTLRLASIFSQLSKREYELGKLARQNRDNWQNWDGVVEKYDSEKEHQIIDPVSKKPIYTNSIVAPGAEGKTTGAGSSTPPASAPNAKQAPDGNWYVPDPNRQGKYLKVVQ